jgi:hypothetical protein
MSADDTSRELNGGINRGIVGGSDRFAGHVDHGRSDLDTDNGTTAMDEALGLVWG